LICKLNYIHLRRNNKPKHHTDMKKYNLSDIMRNAHKLFRNTNKYTWVEALKRAWKMAKFNAWMKEQAEVRKLEEAEEAAKEEARREQAKIQSVLFNAELEAQRIRREAEAKAERMREEIAARKQGISVVEYRERISLAMGYGRGTYCGD
jgi:hypothetical protein